MPRFFIASRKTGDLPDRLFALAELVEHDRRLDPFGEGLVPPDRAVRQVDHRLVSPAGGTVEQDHERLARRIVAGPRTGGRPPWTVRSG